jgi:hypothetical protein
VAKFKRLRVFRLITQRPELVSVVKSDAKPPSAVAHEEPNGAR